MTREEAKEILLHSKMQCDYPHGAYGVAVDMTIKALEQEPILDKIRADVQNGIHHFLDGEPIIEIKEVLQILDKYKAETEDTDGINK